MRWAEVLAEELLHVFGELVFAAACGLVREVTATLTTAGVTRAARVSIAWSSESNALTLLSSSGRSGERGCGRSCRARVSLIHMSPESRPQPGQALGPAGGASVVVLRLVLIQVFMVVSPCLSPFDLATNNLVFQRQICLLRFRPFL